MAAVPLKITDNGNGILVQGTDNVFFPDNATLTFPYNSIILIVDESDMVTFRSAANNDVLFSGQIGKIDIGEDRVTKANIIEKFDAVANQATGGGGDMSDYYTKEEVDDLIPTDVSELDNDAGYITQAEVVINESYPSAWLQSQDMEDLIQAINDDSDAVVGKVYMDTISLSDLPASMQQAEVKVEIMSELQGEGKVLLFTVTSSNTSPYHWEYTSAYGASGTWREWLVASDVANYFDGAEYDSNTKRINFKHNNVVKAYIDATAFIKDGMVDTVVISNGNLVITFNTDAGKQPISIPLTDIFNPANYYDKTATDTLLAAKADSSSLATVATSGSYNDLSNKPTIPAAQVNADWNASSGVAQILNKPTNVSAFTNDAGYLTQHQSLSNYYTKSETDAELADKQDVLTAGTGITIDANNVISATGGGGDYVDVPTFNQKEVAIANALTDLNENKADKTELPDTSTFATKTELNAKQDTLTAGQNITIQNNVISATGGGGASYQFYSENDEEQEEGTTINRHKSGVIEIADEGGTTDSGMGTSYNEIEEDGSISYTEVSSSMYAEKDDGETVNGATIAVNYNYASITVSEDGEDNGTQYSKNTDFIVNPDSLTVEVSVDGVTATQLELNDSGLSINGDNVLTENDAYTKTQVDTALNGKQDTLTAGTGISIQNNVISATGGGGTQVQSDWNQSDSSAVDYIKNKPTIPTVPTTVSSFTNDAHYVPSSDNTIQNIVKKEQSEYDTLVNNSQVDPNTLYIIVPNSI